MFVSDFRNNIDLLAQNDTAELRELRQEAISHFEKLGLPSKQTEAWKYSDIQKVLNVTGRLAYPFTEPKEVKAPVEQIFECDITQLDTHDLALINGWYPKAIPALQNNPNGSKFGSIAKAREHFPELVNPYFAKIAPAEKDAFVALNTAFNTDGIFAYYPENFGGDKALQIVNLVTKEPGSFMATFAQPRNLIVVEKNAKAKIIICDHTLSEDKSFSNSVTEVFVGENAEVEICRIQNQNMSGSKVSALYVHQKAGSKLISNTISLNGGFIRNNQFVELQEPNATANLYGTFLMDKSQQVDNYTYIDHQVPDCESNELFKGILDDEAKGVFRGHILVRKDAQRTNSYQKNNNLILTDKTTMSSMPQLEIYADDVKCSHGATVGYLNQDEMFYLMSRGIHPHEARLLLMNAFVAEIANKISIPALRDRILYLVSKRLRGELSHCASCVLNCRDEH